MKFSMNDTEYTANVPCENPFVIVNGMVYGATPIFEEKYLDLAKEKYGEVFTNLQRENRKRSTMKSLTKTWEKQSENSGEVYVIKATKGKWSCSCKGFTFKKSCKHVRECQEEMKETLDKLT